MFLEILKGIRWPTERVCHGIKKGKGMSHAMQGKSKRQIEGCGDGSEGAL
jgi:hypothetical protein